MRPTVYIHLRDAEASAELAYRIDGAATGSAQQAPLAAIAEQAQGARVIALVPSHAIRFLSVDLPVRNRARAASAAPFACEDRLAEDVERLHFAHLGREENRHAFAVVARQRMHQWRERLAEVGLIADAIVPEVLCLPQPSAEEWCAMVDDGGERLLLRQNRYSGLVTSPDNLATLLAVSGADVPQQLRLLHRDSAPELPPLEDVELLRQPEFGAGLDVMIRYLPDIEASNLLQGVYAPQNSVVRYLLPWRRVAALAVVALALVLALRVADTLRLSAMAEAQQRENLARFSELFPGYSDTRHEQLARYLGAEARAAQSDGEGPAMLPLLESYARAQSQIEGLTMRGLQWRDQGLTLSLRGESLDALETLREWYRDQADTEMDVENADAGSEGVSIRIRLTREAAS